MHAAFGENGNPLAKTEGFVNALLVDGGEQVEIGMQKFCFADFERDTDPERMFAKYEEQVARLQAVRPGLHILHVTTPLLVGDRPALTVAKDLVKSVIGKTTTNERMRGLRRFNQLMRSRYKGTNAIFDLAAIEANNHQVRGSEGHSTESLAAEYATPDGGHLNALGQRVVAAHLLLFLASIPPTRKAE